MFHDIGSITSLFSKHQQADGSYRCPLQYSLSATLRIRLLDYVLELQMSYTVTVIVRAPLRNLLTQLAVDREVAVRLLKCIENGGRVYRVYKQEGIVEKSKNPLNHFKLPMFTDHLKQSSLTK